MLRCLILARKPFQFSTAVPLNYLHYNNNKPLNLVVCHGLLGSHKNFRSFCESSPIQQRANCYLVDMRNHGDSPHAQQHSVELMAADLAQFVQKKKIKNVTMLGHSMGGLALIAFSKLYPQMQEVVKNLILIDVSNKKGAVGQTPGIILQKIQNINVDQPIQNVFKDLKSVIDNQEIYGLLKTNVKPHPEDPDKSLWIPNIRTLLKDYSRLLNFYIKDTTKWENPVDVVYGGDSDYVNQRSTEGFKILYKNFTANNLYRIDNAGHWVHFQKPKEFMKAIDDIFKKYHK